VQRRVEVVAHRSEQLVAPFGFSLHGLALAHLRSREALTQRAALLAAERRVVRRRTAHRRNVGICDHHHALEREDG
jgi:hypothetical protein